jgi:hypothetical protein
VVRSGVTRHFIADERRITPRGVQAKIDENDPLQKSAIRLRPFYIFLKPFLTPAVPPCGCKRRCNTLSTSADLSRNVIQVSDYPPGV